MASEPPKKRISTILIFIAMHMEALPLVNRFQLTEDVDSVFPKGVPWVRYHGFYKSLHNKILQPGKDPTLGGKRKNMVFRHRHFPSQGILQLNVETGRNPMSLGIPSVDSVGTVTASLVTYPSIQALQPDLIINAGTACGFKASGASIGDVFLASEVAFHDRRIPIPVFDLYGVGLRQAFSTPNIVKELNLKTGKVSTGDSLDVSPQDEASISANDATVKDMEGAAVAYVADLLKVPSYIRKGCDRHCGW